jgi:hypothetical protein
MLGGGVALLRLLGDNMAWLRVAVGQHCTGSSCMDMAWLHAGLRNGGLLVGRGRPLARAQRISISASLGVSCILARGAAIDARSARARLYITGD